MRYIFCAPRIHFYVMQYINIKVRFYVASYWISSYIRAPYRIIILASLKEAFHPSCNTLQNNERRLCFNHPPLSTKSTPSTQPLLKEFPKTPLLPSTHIFRGLTYFDRKPVHGGRSTNEKLNSLLLRWRGSICYPSMLWCHSLKRIILLLHLL